mmetsp:Transcript_120115/g.347016  ORF Transcript_120115/g.347016 Transcript_120115/m.347016 type:complete len:308 (-) Transcript_120115:2793-3716(-)
MTAFRTSRSGRRGGVRRNRSGVARSALSDAIAPRPSASRRPPSSASTATMALRCGRRVGPPARRSTVARRPVAVATLSIASSGPLSSGKPPRRHSVATGRTGDACRRRPLASIAMLALTVGRPAGLTRRRPSAACSRTKHAISSIARRARATCGAPRSRCIVARRARLVAPLRSRFRDSIAWRMQRNGSGHGLPHSRRIVAVSEVRTAKSLTATPGSPTSRTCGLSPRRVGVASTRAWVAGRQRQPPSTIASGAWSCGSKDGPSGRRSTVARRRAKRASLGIATQAAPRLGQRTRRHGVATTSRSVA